MNSRLFLSIEVEGRFKGLRTLFVEGNVPLGEIITRIRGANDIGKTIDAVYFGAVYKGRYGTPSLVNTKTVEAVLGHCATITVELLAPSAGLLVLPVSFMVPAFMFGSWYSALMIDPALWGRLQLKWFCNDQYIVVGFTGPIITHVSQYTIDDGTLLAEFA